MLFFSSSLWSIHSLTRELCIDCFYFLFQHFESTGHFLLSIVCKSAIRFFLWSSACDKTFYLGLFFRLYLAVWDSVIWYDFIFNQYICIFRDPWTLCFWAATVSLLLRPERIISQKAKSWLKHSHSKSGPFKIKFP